MAKVAASTERDAQGVEVDVSTEGHWPDDVERILRALPDWFGIEESLLGYVRDAEQLPNVVARAGDAVVGVCLVRRHTPVAAEIELLAVAPDLHRHGIGRRLIERAVDNLRADGVELLQVKTFGPSGESPEYELTRAFYAALGFLPLEERTDIWGPEDPCLISVKPLRP
jgi:GNAT superfamily N-acetyltransferase